MRVGILATGPSMSQAVADRVRETCDAVIAVNTAYELAPWADALAANDNSWWRKNPQAKDFAGRKYSGGVINGVERITSPFISAQSSSGVLALSATEFIAALRGEPLEVVELHGFDNHGTHYFGPYTELRNTRPERFAVFEQQLAAVGASMNKRGIRIVNKTPGSALTCFPFEG